MILWDKMIWDLVINKMICNFYKFGKVTFGFWSLILKLL